MSLKKYITQGFPVEFSRGLKSKSDLSGKREGTSPHLVVDLDKKEHFFNREVSLLDFQQRVLDQARDPRNPLLERLKFLGIVASNLDEFFMVRMAGLQEQVSAGVSGVPPDGASPSEQLATVRRLSTAIKRKISLCFREEILPELASNGIQLLDYASLNPKWQRRIKAYFEEVIFPVLTPLAHDPSRPFPFISSLSLNLAVIVKEKDGRIRFARVKVPSTLPRFVPINPPEKKLSDERSPQTLIYTWIEQVITAHLGRLFPGMEVVESYPFRVIRSADMVIQEIEAVDLLATIEASVQKRRFGRVVRVAVNDAMPRHVREILIDNLGLGEQELHRVEGYLGLSALVKLSEIERNDLKFPSFSPRLLLARKRQKDLFSTIRDKDILLHHPYDSFVPVVEFLRRAAHDPDVLAIKQTLYRVGKDSPVVEALLEARKNGKQVAVLVELKARFDEQSNIGWARALEREGVHVTYGLPGLKTHCKISLVVRKEPDGIRRYVHLATGNYNVVTARLYSDVGIFTCRKEIGEEASDLFNYLTGYSAKEDFRAMLVAPVTLRQSLTRLIEREIQHGLNGNGGRLIFKMNSIVDKQMIQLLYRASQCGLKVDLLVRGICCLRPNVKGLSDNIRVVSIVGRFLEHSRIYYFKNAGVPEIYIGSADLMPRNLDARVEILAPVSEESSVGELINLLELQLSDNVNAYQLKSDGSWVHTGKGDFRMVDSHLLMIERAESTVASSP